MATFKPSLPWGLLQNHWDTTSSSSSCHDTSSFSSHCYQGNMFCHGLKLKLKRNLRIRKGLGIQGCSCKRTRCTEVHCNVSEEEKNFVEILREAQPCINLLKDSTFVVMLSGEVIESPFLDTILKVRLFKRYSLIPSTIQVYYTVIRRTRPAMHHLATNLTRVFKPFR